MAPMDPGPLPEPRVEPGDPPPGGVDAVPYGDGVVTGIPRLSPLVRDADPDHNPSTDQRLPEELTEGEDTDTEATKATEAGHDVPPEQESPA